MAEALASVLCSPGLHDLFCLITSEARFLSRVAGDVDWLRDEVISIRSFLHHHAAAAESTSVDHHRPQPSSVLINHLRDAIYDAEDIIDAFEIARSRPRTRSRYINPSCSLKSLHEIGCRVREIKSALAEISRRMTQYKIDHHHQGEGLSTTDNKFWLQTLLASSPLVQDKDLVGVDEDFNVLLGYVLSRDAELSTISLVGMGGVGKTTLIKRVYNHEEVKRGFDRSAWVYVSQSNQLRVVFSELAKGLMDIPSAEVDALSERELQEGLLSCLEQRRYLLVFDDVWDKAMWGVIRLVLPRNEARSRVIVTTRNAEVASSVVDVKSYVHKLHPLSLEESWALFSMKAFPARDAACSCPEELKETAEGIVGKCGGLPLALVTIGHMMSRKERTLLEWRRVLGSISREFWNGDNDGVRRALLFSYKDLPYPLRLCFLFFSVFPHDSEISRKRLVRLWLAEGVIQEERGEVAEDVAEKYLMELINRNMIQVSIMGSSGKVKACRVHDLLHQLAISISHEDNFSTVCDDQRAEIPRTVRRISIQKNYNNSEVKKGKWQVRSFFMFGTSHPLHSLTHFMRNGLWLLSGFR